LAVDSNEDFIQVPVVAEPSLSSLQFPSIVSTELLTPLSNRLIRHDDSPLGEKILDISEAQAKAMGSPDCIADDRQENDSRSNETDRSSWHQSFSFMPS
jgi:hypothetical protein